MGYNFIDNNYYFCYLYFTIIFDHFINDYYIFDNINLMLYNL